MIHALLPALVLASAAMLQAAQPTLIQNARVFDGVRMLPRASVLIVDSRIQAVGPDLTAPAGAFIVDAAGKTLLPALIDAHAHTQSPEDLKTALSFGIATYLDMFTLHSLAAAMRAEQQAGKGLDRADLRSAGTLITAPGGHGTEYGVPIPTLARRCRDWHARATQHPCAADLSRNALHRQTLRPIQGCHLGPPLTCA